MICKHHLSHQMVVIDLSQMSYFLVVLPLLGNFFSVHQFRSNITPMTIVVFFMVKLRYGSNGSISNVI